ncbi:sialate O-acetylesterase [Algoriphagus sp. SE2]|uniref:sialate O-acetylesterase n=1 Tax=Algoriphagus sp. SE2 TaxID=3141536 RepID=UPI0031CD1B24
MKFNRNLIFCFSLVLFWSCNESQKESSENDSHVTKENFHLYILMGQSNMAGRGQAEAIDTLTHPRVWMLDSTMNWVLARDPMHFDKPVAGVGLGLTFGKIIANENPSDKIGLIPTAVGGSSINAWFKDSIHNQTRTYPYNDMIARAKKALSNGTLKGILWHQGESDTGSEESVANYPTKFYAMLDSLQKDLGIEPVPIVMGEIGHFFYGKAHLAKNMNDIFSQIASENPCIELVSSDGLNHKGDSTHFDSNSYHVLGMRYASKMIELQKDCFH